MAKSAIPPVGMTSKQTSKSSRGELFGADGEDLFALDLEFDAEGRADVAALNDGAANPDIAGKAGGLQGIVKSMTAVIADEGMIGGTKAVFIFEFIEVGDVFEFAGAVGRFARESPVAGRGSGGTAGKTDDGGGNILTGEAVAHKEIGGRPGLGKISNLGDGGIGFRGVRKRSGGIRSGSGHFNLGRRFNAGGFGRASMADPASAKEKQQAEDDESNDEREKRITAGQLGRRTSDAGNKRHVGPKAGGWRSVGHRQE